MLFLSAQAHRRRVLPVNPHALRVFTETKTQHRPPARRAQGELCMEGT